MLLVADLPNGDQFLKLNTDALLNKLFSKTHGVLHDMLPFAKKMVSFLLFNLKFFLMVLTLLKIAKESLKEFFQLFSLLYKRTMSSLKVAFLNQIWLLMDHNTPRKKKTIYKKKPTELFAPCQEQCQLP